MKKKVYNPAAKNKLLFLGLWFVLFTSLVLLCNWLFNKPVMQVDSVNNRLAGINTQIAELEAIQANFLLGYDKSDYLFKTDNSDVEKEAKVVFSDIRGDLKLVRNIRYIRKSPVLMTSINDFSTSLNAVENNLTDILLAFRERGNNNSGIVQQWQSLSDQMLKTTNLSKEGILTALTQIKQSEYTYLLDQDSRILENISILIEEIRNQLSSEEEGASLIDLDSYTTLTGTLMALDKRIGNPNSQGILASFQTSMQELPKDFESTTGLVKDAGEKVSALWTVIRYSVLFIITLLTIFLAFMISRKIIFLPLGQISNYTKKMAGGSLPDDIIVPGILPEIKIIKESLEKHISLLREKISFTSALNQGAVDMKLSLTDSNDQLGTELIRLSQKIIETAEHQEKNDQENLIRRYINEGLAKFGDILRTSGNDINILGDAFIKEVVKYLNAIQGGFFIYDDTDKSAPVLNLVSAFAYNRKKYMQKSIAYGEGLVGTCAREKQFINLTEIPAGYISITSGLGDTLPDNLLLVPVLHEDELIGVLEIASMQKYKSHEIEFAGEVARSLGSTIISARNNQRTSELLAKSQQQALEMAEQEEEMRQNMEELKATQEESNRREEEFKGVADAISNALYVLEYDLEGIIRNANERICSFFGQSAVDIIGKPHYEVFHGTLIPDKHFWDDVRKSSQLIRIEDVTIGKSKFKLIEHFTPIFNRDGIVIKYINFATDDRAWNS